ncbi:MAG TPA: ATP-binding protein [Fimbriiglobus sp.]
MPRLIVTKGPDEGRQFPVAPGAVTTVGRHSGNPVPLRDPQVSRRHFELRPGPEGVLLVDLESGNGTRVNGHPVHTSPLQFGDEIALGESVLLFAIDPGSDRGGSTRTHASPWSTAPESAALPVVKAVPAEVSVVRPAHLAVLYEVAAAVNQILDVDDLLGRVLTLVVRASGADHGCVLLADPDSGELQPRVTRSSSTIRGPDGSLSRTVVDHVRASGEGVLLSDAGADDRFAGGESIARHGIREVICVPLRGRHDAVGMLYLDLVAPLAAVAPGATTARFTPDHLDLAVAVGHQAALAVEETRYYQALVNAERLAAVGQTIAALSHHIKNIMTGVRFGSDMVRTALAENDSDLLGKGWKLVERNQRRIDELILDMLSYSKEREPNLEPTDLVALATDVLEGLRGRAADRKVELVFDPPKGLAKIPCDPEGIHRSLLNVVGNAIDAVEGVESPRVAIHVRTTPDDRWIEVTVEDNGSGVPEDQREAIFKPFVSTKGSRGTGLGLPVSRKTLREHGGDLVVEDASGGGAMFILRIPRS